MSVDLAGNNKGSIEQRIAQSIFKLAFFQAFLKADTGGCDEGNHYIRVTRILEKEDLYHFRFTRLQPGSKLQYADVILKVVKGDQEPLKGIEWQNSNGWNPIDLLGVLHHFAKSAELSGEFNIANVELFTFGNFEKDLALISATTARPDKTFVELEITTERTPVSTHPLLEFANALVNTIFYKKFLKDGKIHYRDARTKGSIIKVSSEQLFDLRINAAGMGGEFHIRFRMDDELNKELPSHMATVGNSNRDIPRLMKIIRTFEMAVSPGTRFEKLEGLYAEDIALSNDKTKPHVILTKTQEDASRRPIPGTNIDDLLNALEGLLNRLTPAVIKPNFTLGEEVFKNLVDEIRWHTNRWAVFEDQLMNMTQDTSLPELQKILQDRGIVLLSLFGDMKDNSNDEILETLRATNNPRFTDTVTFRRPYGYEGGNPIVLFEAATKAIKQYERNYGTYQKEPENYIIQDGPDGEGQKVRRYINPDWLTWWSEYAERVGSPIHEVERRLHEKYKDHPGASTLRIKISGRSNDPESRHEITISYEASL